MANTVGGSIIWNLDVDSSGFSKGMEGARSTANEVAKSIEDRLKNVGSSLESIGRDLSLRLSAPIIGLGAMGVKVAADLETMEQGFITLLGSAEEANDAINMIKKDAAQTPFEITGLIQSNQLLTAVTEDAQRSERMLLNVGKALTAMGKGQPELDRIIVNLQQIGAVGHAAAIDIKQFAFAGIPIYKMLQQELGKTGEEIQQMVSDGEISFDILEGMFNKAGEGSGRFAQAFELQGGTFNQVLSNFRDNINITLSDIAEQSGLFDMLKNALSGLTDALGDFNEYLKTVPAPVKSFAVGLLGVIAAIGPLLIGIGSTLKLTAYAISGFKTLGSVASVAVKGIGLISKAFMLLAANPVILIIAAVIAIIALLAYVIYTNWDKITEATGKLMDFFKKAWDGFINSITNVIDKVKNFFNKLKNLWEGFTLMFTSDEGGPFVDALKSFGIIEDTAFKIMYFFGIPFGKISDFMMDIEEASIQFKETIVNTFNNVKDFIINIVKAIAAPFQWLHYNVIEPIMLLINAIILRIFYEIYQFVVKNFIEPMIEKFTIFSEFMIKCWTFILTKIVEFLNFMSEEINKAFIFITEKFNWLGEQISNILRWIGNEINKAWTWIKDIISEITNAIVNYTKDKWNKICNYIKGPVESSKSTISSVFGWINNFITNTWNSIYNFFNNMVSKIFNALVSPFESAKKKIEEIGQKIRDAANAINPFERHSPSLVDNVKSGLDIIKKEYASLKNIQLPSIMATSANVAEPAYAIAGNSMGYMGNGGINQDININIEKVENKEDVDAIGRELGFRAKLML